MLLAPKYSISLLIFMIIVNVVVVEGLGTNSFVDQDIQDIILSNSLYTSAPRDQLFLENISIDGDILTINFTHGGGCKDHVFKLIGSEDYAESFPVQTHLLLSHDANNDTCAALFIIMMKFNLSPLAEKYLELYKVDSATLVLHIVGGLETETINYYIRSIKTTSTEIEITDLDPFSFLIFLIFFVRIKGKDRINP